MRFDPVAKVFEISVRELAEDEGFHRIGFSGTETWSRFGLGTEIHTRILGERCQSNSAYRREVHLQTNISVGEWTAIITGRLDGCVQNEKGEWLIEEIKSGYFGNSQLTNPVTERHRRQLLIYCDLWRRRGNSPVRGALIYVDVINGTENVVEVRYDEKEHAEEIQRRLHILLKSWKARESIRKQKAEVATRLPFPHSAPRPGQQKLIESIRTSIQQNENLLAEAPTGSGKTAASLHPALSEGLKSGKQVVFLTAKTLQQEMAVKVLKGVNPEGAFRTLQMRSKEKMCANGEMICHEDFCPYAKNYPQKMERSRLLNRLIEKQTHHDPDAVFTEAKCEQVCPFEVQLELAAKADAIVADYNYVFEPGTALKHLDDLENAIVLIDEAHNLADRARKIFSPELNEEVFRKAALHLSKATRSSRREEAHAKNQSILTSAATIQKKHAQQAFFFLDGKNRGARTNSQPFEKLQSNLETVISLLEKCSEVLPKPNAIAEIQPPTEALRSLWKNWESEFVDYIIWKRENKIAQPDDPIVEAHFTLQRIVAMLNFYGPGFSCVIERNEKSSLRLALVCLDPARPLAPLFRSAAATILLSATLSPAESTRRTLGLEANRTSAISLPPPFPRENRKIMILPQVRTTFQERGKSIPQIAKMIGEMSDAVPGNTLVLFPSYEFLSKVAEVLPPTRLQVILQQPNISDRERQKILQTLALQKCKGVLLFAVLGGMYAEGVDYPGDLLSAVFIVSPALPQVSFERELLRRYFDESENAGFAYAYLYPGMTRVIQAAGRLIRSETDRGVIALICQRFLQEPYASCLPKDWFGDSPMELITRNPAEEIRTFFK